MNQMNIVEHLKELEQLLLTDAARKDRELASSLLADEFREFGSSGRSYNKQEILDFLQTEPAVQLSLEDFDATLLADDVALITYRSIRDVAESTPIKALRSSIWVLRDGRWQAIFHQGTRIP